MHRFRLVILRTVSNIFQHLHGDQFVRGWEGLEVIANWALQNERRCQKCGRTAWGVAS